MGNQPPTSTRLRQRSSSLLKRQIQQAKRVSYTIESLDDFEVLEKKQDTTTDEPPSVEQQHTQTRSRSNSTSSFVLVEGMIHHQLQKSLMEHIFSFCGLKDMCRISCVCHTWNQICSFRSFHLWKELANQVITDSDWFLSQDELIQLSNQILITNEVVQSTDRTQSYDYELLEMKKNKYELLATNYFQALSWRQKLFKWVMFNWSEIDKLTSIDNSSSNDILLNMDMCMEKVIIVGSSKVGKSTLRKVFFSNGIHQVDENDYEPTIGCDIDTKIMSVSLNFEGNKDICANAQIWDTSGSEFHDSAGAYMQGANLVIFAYDVTNPTSFNDISSWRSLVQKNSSNFFDIPSLLVALKCDTDSDKRVISTEQGQLYAMKSGMAYLEVSSLTNPHTAVQVFKFAAFFCSKNPATSFGSSHSSILQETRDINLDELFLEDIENDHNLLESASLQEASSCLLYVDLPLLLISKESL